MRKMQYENILKKLKALSNPKAVEWTKREKEFEKRAGFADASPLTGKYLARTLIYLPLYLQAFTAVFLLMFELLAIC